MLDQDNKISSNFAYMYMTCSYVIYTNYMYLWLVTKLDVFMSMNFAKEYMI